MPPFCIRHDMKKSELMVYSLLRSIHTTGECRQVAVDIYVHACMCTHTHESYLILSNVGNNNKRVKDIGESRITLPIRTATWCSYFFSVKSNPGIV